MKRVWLSREWGGRLVAGETGAGRGERMAGGEDMKVSGDGVSELDLRVCRAVCCDTVQSSTRHPLPDECERRVGLLLEEQVIVQVHCESPKGESIYDESIE